MTSTDTHDDPGFGVFHAGELQAHQRYGVARLTRALATSVRNRLNPRLIEVKVQQAYPNCRARIPPLGPATLHP